VIERTSFVQREGRLARSGYSGSLPEFGGTAPMAFGESGSTRGWGLSRKAGRQGRSVAGADWHARRDASNLLHRHHAAPLRSGQTGHVRFCMGAGDADSVPPTVLVPAPGHERSSRRRPLNVSLPLESRRIAAVRNSTASCQDATCKLSSCLCLVLCQGVAHGLLGFAVTARRHPGG
jgi:hypothetical protein